MRSRLAIGLASLLTLSALLASSPAEAVIVERIVAVVGERPILLSELRSRARPFLVQIAQRVPAGPQQTAAESQTLKDLLGKMVEEELEQQAADKAKIRVTEAEIDAAFKNIAASQQLTVEQLVREAADRSGLERSEYRDEIRRQLLEGKLLQLRVKGRVRVTEEDLKNAYIRAIRDERKLREYHPEWLVLRIYPGSSDEAVAQRKALADQIVTRARAGEDFAKLAKQFSDDSATRELGGDLGIRAMAGSPSALSGQRPVMAPKLESALAQLDAGQISAPIRAGDALIILRLRSRQPSRYTTYEAAKPEMMQRMQGEIMTRAKDKWLVELKRQIHVDVRL